jgi:hypothetical protein
MSDITPLAFQDAFLDAFTTRWAAQTPIAYPNVSFDPAALTEWVRVYLLGDDEPGLTQYSNSVASDHFSRTLTATFEVYVRMGTSLDRAYALIDVVLQFLQKPNVSNMIVTHIGSPREIGPDGTWFQVTVSANLLYYTDRPAS